MTTDTFPKGAVEQVDIGGKTVTIAGIAKGSGMIAPDMATMLAYVFTDATVSQDGLQAMLTAATKDELQRHHRRQRHVDLRHGPDGGHGRSHAVPIASGRSAEGKLFQAALTRVMKDLALQIVRDGEGATKLVEVRVTARNRRAMPTRSRGPSRTRRW
jgi:glutamate N-acetyltransferase/amino-acid N-acetyltransferase